MIIHSVVFHTVLKLNTEMMNVSVFASHENGDENGACVDVPREAHRLVKCSVAKAKV